MGYISIGFYSALSNGLIAHRIRMDKARVQLRKENEKNGHIMNKEHPIPIIQTREWTRQYMIRRIQEASHQLNLSGH
jgi:hypothetical protein